MEAEKPTQSTEQERRIYDPVRIEHRIGIGRIAISTGAIIQNTHERIIIIQSQLQNPPATAGEKIIPWGSIESAYYLTATGNNIERPPK